MSRPRILRNHPGLLGAAPLIVGALALAGRSEPGATASSEGVVAVSAGTVHLVEDGRTLEGGATILIEKGRIQAVGSDVEVPPGAHVVDYGPDAVIVPGLVAAYSSYAAGNPSDRTADPGLRAVDAFDPYGVYASALSSGVTSAYITPAENRLIAGQGAVVKLAGDDFARRVVNDRAAIHGAIDSSARNAPGYWEPPIPATVDTGMGYERPQLPKSTMGAIVALNELLDAAAAPGSEPGETEYGYYAVHDLPSLLEARVPWRMSAVEVPEIRALLELARERNLPLIIDKALKAKGIADEIAAAGAGVVFRIPYEPNAALRDHGKSPDDLWPSFDVPAALVRAGVRVAITGSSPRDLLFSANLASRGGLAPEAALRAITLTPAELYGAAGRVGSIAPGKDADLCVLNAPPLSGVASVLATWVDGELAWSAHEGTATVLSVDELHVGDGRVLRPGELLMQDGKIVEVAERVSHPRGAMVVHGVACMPGMIDAFGYLGLEGSRRVPATDFKLRSIVGPGDDVDRRVAARGVTTVVLTPRGATKTGAPVMAYKPAAADFEHLVVGDPVALRLAWSEDNRLQSGESVRSLLEKAKEYRDKWLEYEREIAAWTPPQEPPEEAKKDEKAEKKDEDKGEEEKQGDEGQDKKSKKKKKDEEKELEPDPITGTWQAEVGPAAEGEEEAPPGAKLRMQLVFEQASGSGAVYGNLRCAAVSDDLVELTGRWEREENRLGLRGLGTKGWVSVAGKIEEEKLVGTVEVAGEELQLSAEHTSREAPVAKRPERRKAKDEPREKEPKGKPREPRIDDKLEPLRRAMDGKATIVVEVERDDEILDCVEAFEKVGIRPVLYGASSAYKVTDRLAGRVSGILLSPTMLQWEAKHGTNYRTPYSDLQNAGIPIAFHSDAEEGAADLPLAAAYAVAQGLSPTGALRALTADAAGMMSIGDRVGRLERGLDADVLLLDSSPLEPGASVVHTWVNGEEVPEP